MTIYSLYVKTHNKTGLKYLGFTKQNPQKYKGSGTYWKRHLLVHGSDVSTEVLLESESHSIIKHWGIYYSDKWDIVNSKNWANLKPESGEGGASPRSADTKEKIRKFQKVKVWTEKALQSRLHNCLKNAAARKGKTWSKKKRQSTLTTYLKKNIDIATKVFELHDTGLNNLQIANQLHISWDKVMYSLKHRLDFESYQKCQR